MASDYVRKLFLVSPGKHTTLCPVVSLASQIRDALANAFNSAN